jgi:ELWxxDGT repeat protein
VYDGKLYFQAIDSSGYRLYAYDGSNAVRVTDLFLPVYLTVFNNELYMGAYDLIANGLEIWKYDGETATLVQDLNISGIGGYPTQFTVYNDKLYFSATDGTTGQELWVYG